MSKNKKCNSITNINNIMKNSQLLKGFSIEELQERNEFTAAIEDAACCNNKCVFAD